MYSRTPFRFLSVHLHKYLLSLPASQYFFPGTIPFLSFGIASNRPILCNKVAVFNLAASTERPVINILVFTAVLISDPADHGEVLCCTQLDSRAVQLCFLP